MTPAAECAIRPHHDDEAPYLDMSWAVPLHPKRRVNEAARILLVPLSDVPSLEAYLHSYDIINNWRASHSFPLNTFQNGLRRRCKQVDETCVVAQRIKRLSSIAQKLERFPTMTLSQMQDVGGCRAILQTVRDVREVRDGWIESDIKHRLHHEDDYVATPRESGYRGIHLVYRYYSDRKETYNSLLIEMQIRSLFQHAWATAVETVGTFVGQALKASHGADDWLRFFALMGAAIAEFEGCPTVPNTPSKHSDLVEELREHGRRLDVINRLRGYSQTLRVLEEQENRVDHYFLIALDPSEGSVRITGYRISESEAATAAYLEVEKLFKDKPGADAVLVSVDSVAALRRAYPNYFADTALFANLVSQTIRGKRVVRPTVPV